MDVASTKALMRRITEQIWNDGDLDLIDELVAADFIDHVDIPGLETSGRGRYRASVELIRRAFPDYREEIELVVAEEDLVVSYVRITGTQTGDLMGLPPSGRKVDYRSAGILRFREGQVTERWGVGDTATMYGQLGLLG